MIVGVGIDIVNMGRIEQALARYPVRFAERLLSQDERELLETTSQMVTFVAGRFAAKEAFYKALGTGLREPYSFQQISISNDALGKPILTCQGAAQEALLERRAEHCHLSISHEKANVVAMVILESLI